MFPTPFSLETKIHIKQVSTSSNYIEMNNLCVHEIIRDKYIRNDSYILWINE